MEVTRPINFAQQPLINVRYAIKCARYKIMRVGINVFINLQRILNLVENYKKMFKKNCKCNFMFEKKLFNKYFL